eukprot:scaffold587149_cov38-Prasinocladus_malaysianus.AAC.1
MPELGAKEDHRRDLQSKQELKKKSFLANLLLPRELPMPPQPPTVPGHKSISFAVMTAAGGNVDVG